MKTKVLEIVYDIDQIFETIPTESDIFRVCPLRIVIEKEQ